MDVGTEVIFFDDGIRRLGRVEQVRGDVATVDLASDGSREVWVEQLQPVAVARRIQLERQAATRVYRVPGGMAFLDAGGIVE